MAINFLSNINLNKNELQLAVFQNLPSAPGTPLEGQVYYNTADDNLYVYTGTGWVDLTNQSIGEQNVQSDWDAVSGDAFILNKPTIPSGNAVIDWTQAGAGTIHIDNYIENVVQTNIIGNAGTVTNGVYTTGDQTIGGIKTFSSTIVGSINGNAATATNVAYSGLTGTVPTWNQNTTGNAATVTTNANLTGHVTSVGNATSLGSFTVAQLSTALSDASISGTNTGDQTNITGNAGTVTNGVYTVGNQTIGGTKTFSSAISAPGGNSTEWNTAYDNRITSLTTTGTTGAATLISNVLNIPNYADTQGVTSVGGTAPIVSSGGTTPDISITAATTGAAGSMSAPDKEKLDGIPGDIITEAEGIGLNDNDTSLPTSAAVKDYVDSAITVGMVYKGAYNASTNVPALDTGSPAVIAGDTYTVTAAGNFFTEAVQVGDVLISEITGTVAASLANWTVLNKNIPDIVNASTTVSGIVQLATIGETNTGTLTTKAVTPDGLDGWTGSGQITTLGTIGTGAWQGSSISTSYTDAKVVSVGGTTNRITINGTTGSPTVDIASTYVGQTSITTLGTISTGTWQGTAINQTYLVGQSGTNTGDEVAATTSVAGIVELAINAEVNAGTDTGRVITPSGLGQWPGSTSITTLGTIATGTWQGTAINQTYLVGQSGTNTGDELPATTSVEGVVQLATIAQVQAGTDTTKVVTPDGLAARSVVAQILVASLTSGVAQIVHNLGTEDIIVQLFDSTTKETVFADVARTTLANVASTSTIKISFGQTPANNVDVIITSARGATSVTPTYS